MTISTSCGDCGETTLVDETRAWKADPRVAAAGDLDELACCLGTVGAWLPATCGAQREQLVQAQRALLQMAAVVQSAGRGRADDGILSCERLAGWMAAMESSLGPAGGFLLPGGSPAAAQAHVARAVCRRAERALAPLLRSATGAAAEHLRAVGARLNRLGDWLFLLARYANLAQGVCDERV